MLDATKNASLSISAAATLACIYEATAPKSGNVHPNASFDDATTYVHFVTSAVVTGPIVERAATQGVGQTVLEAVRATRDAVGTNTNLGTLLLVVPLAAVPLGDELRVGAGAVLDCLTADDTRLVYEAIRISAAGGLGKATEADVFDDALPQLSLTEAMRLAADRDLVARQYTNRFADLFDGPARWIASGLERGLSLSRAIVEAHLRQIQTHGDSLIARKCGVDVSNEARRRATVVLAASGDAAAYDAALINFDRWLRADGHRRNPGTSADFVAAGLFVLLREGRLDWRVW